MNKRIALITTATIVGLLRPLFVFHDFNRHIDMTYQAAAHILIGVLLGGCWYCVPRRTIRRTFWALVAVEVLCATITLAMKA